MSTSWIQRTIASRYLWAALGGLALAAAFPKAGIAGLAWVAPGWILFSALGSRGGERFRIGYVGGYLYALGAFYWLLFIPFPAGAVGGWFALSAYLAVYMASWVALCWRILPEAAPEGHEDNQPLGSGLGGGSPNTPALTRVTGLSEALMAFSRIPWHRRVVWALGCAVIWVALEMVLARLFTGFPWNLLGVSQYRILPIIQIASWTGVYGISFLVVWLSVSLMMAGVQILASAGRPKSWVGDLVLPLVTLLGVVAFGASRLGPVPAPERTLRVALIQPSIPQTLIWDTNQNAARFTQLVEISERALRETTHVQLLVWPEAAIPNMLRYDRGIYSAVTNLAISRGIWMILGSDDAAPRPGTNQREYDYFNSGFLITPRGEIAANYQKRRLVIFGEYIPLERWLPLMKYLTPVGGSFAVGSSATPFFLPELAVKLSVLICFEDIFPHYTREYVETDTDFLLNLTNNGWFGESAAQWQHAADAVFRAVEGRVPLVRCTNNGLTCWVDARGGLHDVFVDETKGIYGEGFKIVDIPLLDVGQRRELTFYTGHGDWFGWACVALAALPAGRLLTLKLQARLGKRFAPVAAQGNR